MRPKFVFWVAFLLLPCGLTAGTGPELSDVQKSQVKSLPFGISQQKSLIVRSRHIRRVRMSGAASRSQYGFSADSGVTQEALWLRLVTHGRDDWSSCLVDFDESLDASRYNSLAIWVRTREPEKKLFLTLRDRTWQSLRKPQSKTVIFPTHGFPTKVPLQVVIPFRLFKGSSELDFSKLQTLGIEFGSESVNNTDTGEIEILGMAFVDQSKPIHRLLMHSFPGVPFVVTADDEETAQKPAPKQRKRPAPETTREMDSVPSLSLNVPVSQLAVPIPVTPRSGSASLSKQSAEAEVKNNDPASVASSSPDVYSPPSIPRIRTKIASWLKSVYFPYADKNSKDPSRLWEQIKKGLHVPLYLLVFIVLLTGALFGHDLILKGTVHQKEPAIRGKIIHKINWPLIPTEISSTEGSEKKFWRMLAERNLKTGWLSPFHAHILKEKEDQYHGESFLIKQIKLASRYGIRVLPSVCFARTVFNLDTFLTHPSLYLTRPIPPQDVQLSDVELRVKHIGYFPVWIPPYWQKKHGLPQKLLVAFGKLPGMMPTSDSVQFNLPSSDLRQMAVRILDKFARLSPGVRIEGASTLLNNSLHTYWGNDFDEPSTLKTEFWPEVISSIKAKYPDFLFVADGVGNQSPKILEMGFDLFENNLLTEVLVNQIRLEEVGNLEKVLSPENSRTLSYSIFDVSPLLKSIQAGTSQRQQNLLAAMILGLFPGYLQYDGQVPEELQSFFELLARFPVFAKGEFCLLHSNTPEVFAFARWDGGVIYIATANFSTRRQHVSVKIDPLNLKLDERRLYFFSDLLYGSLYQHGVRTELLDEPALAVLGLDLREAGFSFSLSELSLRLFSVNLGTPIRHANPSKVREFHQT